MEEFKRQAISIASRIAGQDEVLIVTHIDADGITSGTIAHLALERLGIENRIKFVKQLDEREIERIKDENVFVWFTDLGSGQIDMLNGLEFAITDHHLPQNKHRWQLNPHDYGYDGTTDLSGSGCTFFVAKFLRKGQSLSDYANGNDDLLPLAVVGAVGDLQDSKWGKLVGINSILVKSGVKSGYLKVARDLKFFGKQTRPVAKMLEYNTDPIIPGITGSERGVLEFLSSIEVEAWKKWIELTSEEKRRVVSGLVNIAMEYHLPHTSIFRIVGDSYLLLQHPEGTELRDAMEFSTLLNATARYGEAEVGLRVCLGEEDAKRRARTLLQNHRRNLSEGIRFVDENGIEELRYIRYFHAGNKIPDTIVGIVAGMCFHKGNAAKPIVAFAQSDDGIKVSARANYRLVEKGLHLAKALKKAAERVGGVGGGHSVAAGATIPRGEEERFLKILDDIIGEQFKGF